MHTTTDIDSGSTYIVTYHGRGEQFRRCDACLSFKEALERAGEIVRAGLAKSAAVSVMNTIVRVDDEKPGRAE